MPPPRGWHARHGGGWRGRRRLVLGYVRPGNWGDEIWSAIAVMTLELARRVYMFDAVEQRLIHVRWPGRPLGKGRVPAAPGGQ